MIFCLSLIDSFASYLILSDAFALPTLQCCREEARPYVVSLGFKDLPRQTSGDWLCGVTDPNLADDRRFKDGRDASNPPASPEKMEAAYLASDIRKKAIQELDQYKTCLAKELSIEEEFRAAVLEDKNKGVRKVIEPVEGVV